MSYKNISKDKYLDKETGEIKERKKSENRYQTPKSVRKSINRLMDLIKCNANEPSHCKWVTLTYGEAMTDHKRVYEDGKMFLRRLQKYLDNNGEIFDSQKSFQRITVAEPQGETHDNSWHLHILIIFNVSAQFIDNEVMAGLWGYGITDTLCRDLPLGIRKGFVRHFLMINLQKLDFTGYVIRMQFSFFHRTTVLKDGLSWLNIRLC